MTTSQNQKLIDRSLASVWHPCTQMKHHEQYPLLALAKGEGVWLYDYDGNRYLDAISSWWVNLFGHANPYINHALKQQLDTLEHTMLAGATHESVVELSERLAALTQHQLGHSFYASDGASAIEIALKMSFHYWKNSGQPDKQEFICLKNSYHGETLGALSVTDVALFKETYSHLMGSMASKIHIAANPDNRQAISGQSSHEVTQDALGSLEAILQENHSRIAALIIEPLVQCATGMAMYDANYIRGAKDLCKRYEVHLIADEIAVGCGRTGTFFACEQAQVWPDFMALSKGISGGYLPLSIVMTTNAIYEAFYDDHLGKAFLHSHSYTGNPLACRAALATLEIFEQESTIQKNQLLAQTIQEAFAWTHQDSRLEHIRQKGTIFACDVKAEFLNQLDTSFSKKFAQIANQQQLLIRPIGQTIYIMPAYIISNEELLFLSSGIKKTLDLCLAV